MRSGTRWVTLMKVPETPSAGMRLNCALAARSISVTRPRRRSAGNASTEMSAASPIATSWRYFSSMLASTRRVAGSNMLTTGCAARGMAPGSSQRRTTQPSKGALTVHRALSLRAFSRAASASFTLLRASSTAALATATSSLRGPCCRRIRGDVLPAGPLRQEDQVLRGVLPARPGGFVGCAGLVEVVLGHRVVLEERLGPVKIQPRHRLLVLEAPGGRLAGLDLLRPVAVHRPLVQRVARGQAGPGGDKQCLGMVQGRLGYRRVQPEYDRVLADELALVHGNVDHPAVDLRGNVDQMAAKAGIIRVNDPPHEDQPVGDHARRDGRQDVDPVQDLLWAAAAVGRGRGVFLVLRLFPGGAVFQR